MLAEFILAHRDAISGRAQARFAWRSPPLLGDLGPKDGVRSLLDQLVDALRRARSSDDVDHDDISASSARNGNELFRMGLTIGQVVHGYGDICQIITEMCVEEEAQISAREFRLLNLCLDDAIAGAVTEYALQQRSSVAAEGTERIGMLSHELRNYLGSAMLAFESIASGRVAVSGSTGALLRRSLVGLQDLLDRSIVSVRLEAGIGRELVSARDLISDVETGAALQAEQRGIHFSVANVARDVTVAGGRQILAATLANLLQNAFKFTHPDSHVSLRGRATADRVFFDVEDECGGLPPGKLEGLFTPFEQRGADRTGVGLGLSICRKAAQANGGEIRVRDVPGKGCIFTLELPRAASLAPTIP